MANTILPNTGKLTLQKNRMQRLSRSRENQRKREYLVAKWFKNAGLEKDDELADLYMKYLLSERSRRMKKNAK